MPTITAETPRSTATYAGVELSAPHPFTAGHALTANEAAFLNRVAAGAVGNAMAGDVRRGIAALDAQRAAEFKAGTYTGPLATNAKGKEVPAAATASDLAFMSDPQSYYDAKYSAYTLGESNRGSGETTTDPVTKAIKAMATDRVKSLLKAKGKNIRTVMQATDPDGTNTFVRLVREYAEKHDAALRPIAEAQVASLSELDEDTDMLDGIEADATEAQPEA